MNTTYFGNLNNEALALLVEARNYISALRQQETEAREQHRTRDSSLYLGLSLETMRLTSRLTQVMAWMLAQRAVMAGEISPEEGNSERFRLSGQNVCLQHDAETLDTMPDTLRDLLQRSYDLYARVARLEQQIGDRLAAAGENENGRPEGRPSQGLRLLSPMTTSDQNPQNAY
jgi:regulator of CtrA degradation